ncbi:hypothetical protein DFP72DRAFT_116359 [Ephemerocybe angulata]|uniref:Uncharacterized protein n=1 Tax=Ephemerocybe angulata TaxID=980116 RepID=A0A8H6I916_9AGAR|nr:hypothetical protein DFP72DRAFT_116359 [Tulosesus angulatus]
MGTIASRESSPTMPGSLSMEPSPSIADPKLFDVNDELCVAPDVMTLELEAEEPNHQTSAQSRNTQPPSFLSLSGLREALCDSSDPASGPDPSETAVSTPSSSDVSSLQTPADTDPIAIPAPKTDMTTMHFHSPSSQIVGTPFATSSTPFEYPFPQSTSGSTSSSHFSSYPASSAFSIAAPPPPSPPHMPLSLPSTTTTLSLTLAMPMTLDFSPHSQISLTHPKMRTTPPPIPPSLLKKRKDRLQSQARRATVDVGASPHVHGVHHAASESNLNLKTGRRRSGAHGALAGP